MSHDITVKDAVRRMQQRERIREAAPEMHSFLVETLQTLTTALEAGELTDGLFLAGEDLQALLARLEEK